MFYMGFPKQWSTIKKLIWLKLSALASAIIQTVTGSAPLSLPNAIAHAIKSLTQTGKCTQSTTPTPSAPVDIKCNNGALKMLNLANMAESNLDIGYYLNNSGVRTQSALNFYTLGFIPVKASTTYTMKTSASLNYFSIMEYDSAKGFLNRTLWGSTSSPAGNTTTFTTGSTTAYLRFGSNMNGNTLTYADIAAVTWMLTEGATAQDYVPYGQLSVVGTPEVISVGGKNWFNKDADGVMLRGFPSSSGGFSTSENYRTIIYKLPENGVFTITRVTASSTSAVMRVVAFSTAPPANGAQGTPLFVGTSSTKTATITVPVGSPYVATYVKNGSDSISDADLLGGFQIEAGDTATAYEPYKGEPQTASAVNLFQVGNYADTQEIIRGAVNRKIGIYVFDGTETWIDGNYGYITEAVQDQSGETYTPLSTHFRGTTGTPQSNSNTFRCYRTSGGTGRLYFAPDRTTYPTKEDFGAFIAAQYAAGTPVIVVYPLKEETTESATAQPLSTVAGTNTVSVVSNVDPVTLTAEYYATE